jgi:hypothetical protein
VGNSQTTPQLRAGCPITDADLAEVAELRQQMIGHGYKPIAVHSPWSPFVDSAVAGKQPLSEVCNGEKIPWGRGHSDERLSRVTRSSANTGVVLGGHHALAAIDIDPAKHTSEPDQVAFTEAVLELFQADSLQPKLNRALVRRRRPGSIVLLLGIQSPMTKRRIVGERGAVELLCQGQQVLVHGWHPHSLSGTVIRWNWYQERAPWTVPVSELPLVPSLGIEALLQRVAESNALGAPLVRTQSTTLGRRFTRSAVYPATRRLNELFATHGGLVKPAIRQLIAEIGEAECGRHDAVVAICGRIVLQRWADERALDFLVPIVNEHFGDGDWTKEIQDALDHARRREVARLSKMKTAVWR